MSSLIGHVLGAEAALGLAAPLAPEAARTQRAVWIAGILAVLPDLDVLVYAAAGRPAWLKPQESFPHSLLFALVLGVVGTLFLLKGKSEPERQRGLRVGVIMILAALAHPALDMLSHGRGVSDFTGAPLYWPFLDRLYLSPVRVLPDAYYATDGLGALLTRNFLYWRSWIAMLIELVILVPLNVLAWKRGLPAAACWTIAGTAAAGALLAYMLYQAAGVL
jgi:hypothetical protein